MKKRFATIKIDDFPKIYDFTSTEKKLIYNWDSSRIFKWNPDLSKKQVFSVDTPPPTASGYLHMGHVFSYAHQDFIVRFQRMRGKNIGSLGWWVCRQKQVVPFAP